LHITLISVGFVAFFSAHDLWKLARRAVPYGSGTRNATVGGTCDKKTCGFDASAEGAKKTGLKWGIALKLDSET
jgi:hypothetical protein